MLNLFKKRKCGNCKHFAPKYPQASPDALFFLLGQCSHLLHSSAAFAADFAYAEPSNPSPACYATQTPADKPLTVGRNFGCVRHKFK